MVSRLAAILVVVSLAACSSGIRQSPILPAVPTAQQQSRGGALIVRVKLPRSALAPNYVGPSTKGMTVSITGPTTIKKTVGLKVTANGCKSTFMTLECTLDVPGLAPCPSKANCYTASVTTYDAYRHGKIPQHAHALSEDLTFDFSIGSTATVIPMVLYGIPKAVKLLPGGSSSLTGSQAAGFVFPKCSDSPQSLSLVATDADGNFIVGVGAPKITLSSDDPSQMKVSGGKGGIFKLSAPKSPLYAHGGHVVHLTAKATAPKDGGGSSATTHVNVAYSDDICGTFTEFAVPSGSGSEPFTIAVGPDGALWFTEAAANKIGRITTGGAVTEFSGLTAASEPAVITTGPDHNLWFTELNASKIARMTTSGTLVEYPTLTASSEPGGIVTGPDGKLWYTEVSGNKIGSITTSGSLAEHSIPTSSSSPQFITVGPDNALWFTEGAGNKIGRVTTAGVVSDSDVVPTAGAELGGIAVGSDGEVWFTELTGQKIGRLQVSLTGDTFNSEFPLESGSTPEVIALGPDGNLWFTEGMGNRIASISPAGKLTEYSIPTNSSTPVGITTGPDGALWFVEAGGGKIGRLR